MKTGLLFSNRTAPWSSLGTNVGHAHSAVEVLQEAGMDWDVVQKDIHTEDGDLIPGYKANIRDSDNKTLGIVTDKYQIVQNKDAFAFTDALLGEGVTYETAGVAQDGKKVWILAKMPEKYIIAGDEVSPYFIIMNSHDGSCSIKAAMTPIRVACQNALNLALRRAKRTWMTKHTANIHTRMEDARNTLFMANQYMTELGRGIDEIARIRLSDRKVGEYMDQLFPVTEDMSHAQKKNSRRQLEDMRQRYFEAPDLQGVGRNGYRFINAVSDFALHAEPIRRSKNYDENLLLKTVEGNPMVDRAYQMVLAA